MAKMKYFPLTDDEFVHSMGVRALASDEPLILVTPEYASEVSLKRTMLDNNVSEYYAKAGHVSRAEAEAFEYLLRQAAHLHQGYNSQLKEVVHTGESALVAIARHLQEDLVLLRGDRSSDFPVMSGVVCFPSGWSIRDKLGQGVLQTHAPVPGFERQLGRSTQHLLDRLKDERPVWRMNWGIRPSSRLDQSPRHAHSLAEDAKSLHLGNVGAQCFLRVERQTLSRLPSSGAILFTIHTLQSPLHSLTSAQRLRLYRVVQSCPEETRRYKGFAEWTDLLLAYLKKDATTGTLETTSQQ